MGLRIDRPRHPDAEISFLTSMARDIEDVAQAAGFSVVLCNMDEDQAKETRHHGQVRIALKETASGV
jgi:LacI family transcriptional regulator